MQILTRFWVTLLLFCVRFPAVSSDNPSSLVEYLEEYVPDETLRRLVDTGVEVRWKSIKAKTYSDDAVLKLSDDFATVKVAKKSDGKGPVRLCVRSHAIECCSSKTCVQLMCLFVGF